jgi:hypothetical protein
MLPNSSGTPVKVMLLGMWYELMADCDPQASLSGVKVEATATSGSSVFKYTKQAKSIKGISFKVSISEYNLLSQMIAALAVSLPCGLMYADKSVVTAPGRVDLGDHSGADGKANADIYFDDLVIVAG